MIEERNLERVPYGHILIVEIISVTLTLFQFTEHGNQTRKQAI